MARARGDWERGGVENPGVDEEVGVQSNIRRRPGIGETQRGGSVLRMVQGS